MKFQNALLRAAQGDRLTNMATRGSAVSDDMDDMRAACQLCDFMLNVQHASAIGDRVAALLGWMENALTEFAGGAREVVLPLHLQQTLRDIGEELRDNAEDELDRLALQRVRRMLRIGAATRHDQWALQRVLHLVDFDGFTDPDEYATHVRNLRSSVRVHSGPVPIDAVAADELMQVLIEFA